MDPCPLNENEKIIYQIIGCNVWDSIKVYNSFEHFKMQNYNEYKIIYVPKYEIRTTLSISFMILNLLNFCSLSNLLKDIPSIFNI